MLISNNNIYLRCWLHLSELEFKAGLPVCPNNGRSVRERNDNASLKRYRNKESKKKTQLSEAFKKIIHLFTNGRVLQSGLKDPQKDCHKTFVHQWFASHVNPKQQACTLFSKIDLIIKYMSQYKHQICL